MALRGLHDFPREQTEGDQPAFFECNAFLQALEISSYLQDFLKRTESGLINDVSWLTQHTDIDPIWCNGCAGNST